jgi:hypothetical protein
MYVCKEIKLIFETKSHFNTKNEKHIQESYRS